MMKFYYDPVLGLKYEFTKRPKLKRKTNPDLSKIHKDKW
jgi:hypothetical protein